MLFSNISSIWKQADNVYAAINVNGTLTWKSITNAFANVGGIWKEIYSTTVVPVSPQFRVTISQSTNATTGIITLTGTNYAWTGPGPRSLTYKFEKSTDNITWSDLTAYASITEPALNSSNTVTYNLVQANVIANTTNYYRFTVHASAGTTTYGDSTSLNTTVEATRNITNLSAANNASTPTTQMDLTWTSSLNAGRQQILYKKSIDSVWTNFGGVIGSTTSITVTGLILNTSYDFKIIPWTGTIGSVSGSFTGYYGNDSNITTKSTTAAAYTFSFGDIISVSTNGYVSINGASNSADSVTSTTGKVIAIVPRDLQQSNLYYWSDTTTYKIRWEGYNYQASTQTQVYEIKFTKDTAYADVYLITSASAAAVTGALYVDGVAKTNYPAALSAGSKYRVYFDGTTAPTTVSYTAQSTSTMKTDTTNNGGDVAETSLTTATNQTGSGGGGGAAPVIISLTGNNSLSVGGTFSWSFSNSPTAYSIFVTGPTGTVFTTSNAYTYTGQTFRPGYDGTGFQGGGNYTIYVSAKNASGSSVVSNVTTYMN